MEFITFLFASSHFCVAHVASIGLLLFSATSELAVTDHASETQRWVLYDSHVITKRQLMGIWGDSSKTGPSD